MSRVSLWRYTCSFSELPDNLIYHLLSSLPTTVLVSPFFFFFKSPIQEAVNSFPFDGVTSGIGTGEWSARGHLD